MLSLCLIQCSVLHSRIRLTCTGGARDELCCSVQDQARQTEVFPVMQGLVKSLPMYVWLVALSQLTSRICHPHEETKLLTQHILTRVIAAFPHQVLLRSGM